MAKLKTCCGCCSLEMGGFSIGILTIITCLTYLLWTASRLLHGVDEIIHGFRDFCLKNPLCSVKDPSCELAPDDPSCCLMREICHTLPGKDFNISDYVICALELFALIVSIVKFTVALLLLKDINEQNPRMISHFINIDLISIAAALLIAITLNIVTYSPVLLVIFIIWMLLLGPIEIYIVMILKSLSKKFEAEQKRIEQEKQGTKV